jgi:hypothetical protein
METYPDDQIEFIDEGTTGLTDEVFSQSNDYEDLLFAPSDPNIPGRKAQLKTKILRLFKKPTKTKTGKLSYVHPKLEYLRAAFIRFEKKLIRTILTKKKLHFFEKKLHYNLSGLMHCVDFVKLHIKYMKVHRLADTKSDPTGEESEHPSFNEDYCSAFYDHELVYQLHLLLMEALFSAEGDVSLDQCDTFVEEFLNISATELACTRHESLKRLHCLLISEAFKGQRSEDNSETRSEDNLRSLLRSIYTSLCFQTNTPVVDFPEDDTSEGCYGLPNLEEDTPEWT